LLNDENVSQYVMVWRDCIYETGKQGGINLIKIIHSLGQ